MTARSTQKQQPPPTKNLHSSCATSHTMSSRSRTSHSRSSSLHREELPTSQNPFIHQNDGTGRDEYVGAQPRPLVPPHFAPRLRPSTQPERTLHPSHALRSPGAFPGPSRTPSPRLRFQDAISPRRHRDQARIYSRARNFSSEAESQESAESLSNPFGDSNVSSRVESDDESLNTQTVARKYSILPSTEGLLVFPEDVENDDYLHNPSPDDKDGNGCHVFSVRGIANTVGAILLVSGLLILIIFYPLL